jgi:phosphocarrier protein HPr
MQTPPISRVIVIQNELGLHMRPATLFAQLASKFEARVEVVHLGRRVDARNIIDLLTLGASKGTQLTLEAEGPDAQQAVDALAALAEGGFQGDNDQQPAKEKSPEQ